MGVGLDEGAEAGKHGDSAVLELDSAVSVEGLFVLGKSERVEEAAGLDVNANHVRGRHSEGAATTASGEGGGGDLSRYDKRREVSGEPSRTQAEWQRARVQEGRQTQSYEASMHTHKERHTTTILLLHLSHDVGTYEGGGGGEDASEGRKELHGGLRRR